MKPTLTINLNAIKQNYLFLKDKIFPAECSAVVKANAYGLGVKKVAVTLAEAGCKLFFVATVDEGIELRDILPNAEIAVLNGVQNIKPFLKYNLIPVINNKYEIDLWKSDKPVIIQIDTGMNRLGLTEELTQNLKLKTQNSIKYIISHLACADEPNNPMNKQQLEKFKSYKNLGIPLSLSASSAMFSNKEYIFDMIRAGLAIYGGNPTPEKENPMKQVIKLTAPIISTREVGEGGTIGYGGAYTATNNMKIATIPVGYADGLPRCLEGKMKVMINGQFAKVVGRISMDLITIDITNIEAKIDDEVEIINDIITIDKIANWAGTIAYEILTSLGGRYECKYS